MKTKAAFTLVETIAALAIFVLMATSIGGAVYNLKCLVDLSEKNPDFDAQREFIRTKILEISSRDDLESGIECDLFDSSKAEVVCQIEETQIPDLFLITASVKSQEFSYTENLYVIRSSWYENSDTRQTLIDDRRDYLEQKRISDYSQRHKK